MATPLGPRVRIINLINAQSKMQEVVGNILDSHRCTTPYGTAQYSTLQYSTVQYSTAQHSTAQHSTALQVLQVRH